jgi:enoyl-CoA hydratase/carnithine racemase
VTAAPGMPAVLVENSDGIYTVRLNRPAQRNSMVWESWEGLKDALDRVGGDPEARAIVLTGAGTFFCSGGDRKTSPRRGNRALAPVARLEFAHRVMLEMSRAPVVVIGAVEGGAVGLGWGLALSCDLIIASGTATFSAPFVSLGLVPDGGTAWHLVQRVGRHRAMQLLLSGRKMCADEAFELGLVTSVCAEGASSSMAHDIARDISRHDATAVELTKRMAALGQQSDLSTFLGHELVVASHVQLGRDRAT